MTQSTLTNTDKADNRSSWAYLQISAAETMAADSETPYSRGGGGCFVRTGTGNKVLITSLWVC